MEIQPEMGRTTVYVNQTPYIAYAMTDPDLAFGLSGNDPGLAEVDPDLAFEVLTNDPTIANTTRILRTALEGVRQIRTWHSKLPRGEASEADGLSSRRGPTGQSEVSCGTEDAIGSGIGGDGG